MIIEDLDEVKAVWKSKVLVGMLEDYSIEVEGDIPEHIISMGLYLDYLTVKNAGESMDVYKGYMQATQDMMNFLGLLLFQDDERKLIILRRSQEQHEKQKMLKELMWGPD